MCCLVVSERYTFLFGLARNVLSTWKFSTLSFMSTLGVAKSVEKLQNLTQGVLDRGSTLTANWRAECVQRKDGRWIDVYYYSPTGTRFRSYSEVYRHLGLPANAGARPVVVSRKRSQSSPDGEKQGDSKAKDTQQQAEDTDSNPEPESWMPRLGIRDLPEALHEIPITCNSKPGTWHVALSKVECRASDCSICRDKPAADRFMTRSGVHGFTRHAGLAGDSHVWKAAFKVDLPGIEGMSIEKYFHQHKCNLVCVGQAGNHTAANHLPGNVHTSDKPSAALKSAKVAKRHKPLMADKPQLGGSTSSEVPGPSCTEEAVNTNENLHLANPSGSATLNACHETSLLNTLAKVADADGHSDGVSLVEQAASTAEITKLQARHAAEVKGLKAQIAQGRVEHGKAVKEIARLSTELYDLKTGNRHLAEYSG